MRNPTIASTVYALGRIDMVLINKEAKTVQIVNDFNKDYDRATDYDWNSGGGFMRSTAIAIEKRRASIPKNAGVRVFYYGIGKLSQ